MNDSCDSEGVGRATMAAAPARDAARRDHQMAAYDRPIGRLGHRGSEPQ